MFKISWIVTLPLVQQHVGTISYVTLVLYVGIFYM